SQDVSSPKHKRPIMFGFPRLSDIGRIACPTTANTWLVIVAQAVRQSACDYFTASASNAWAVPVRMVLLHDFKINRLRSSPVLVFGELVGDYDLHGILARLHLRAELQLPGGHHAFDVRGLLLLERLGLSGVDLLAVVEQE